MTVEIDSARYKSEFEGKTYYFCSAGCKRAFDKTPLEYLQAEAGKDD